MRLLLEATADIRVIKQFVYKKCYILFFIKKLIFSLITPTIFDIIAT